jgi:hypothetical protein
MLVSDAIVRHLSEDNALSEEAAHLQLFVEEYCTTEIRSVELPFSEGNQQKSMHCAVRIKRYQAWADRPAKTSNRIFEYR